MPAAWCPGQGTIRRLMSRGRLSTRRPCGGDRRSSGGGAEPGDKAPTARGSVAPCGTASPLDALGQTDIRSLRRRLRARAARQAPRQALPRAPEALAGPGRDREDPSRRGRLNLPKALQAPLPRLGRARERSPPAKLPEGAPQARSGAPLPRRERAAPLSRRTRRRAGLPNPSSR